VERAREIDRANIRLVGRLHAVATAPPKMVAEIKQHDLHMANVLASTLRRRQKEEDAVITGNMRLYRKLQAVKPSEHIERQRLHEEFQYSRKMLEKLSMRREAPSMLPLGLRGKKPSWNDRWCIGAKHD
jgi:hypothetical protein